MDLIEHVAENMARHRLLRRGARVVVAVSGGVDSVVLLHVLHRLAGDRRWQLHVAHFNHGLRGRASSGDETFTRRLAERLGIPCVTDRAAVGREAKARGVSVEMAARDLRHAFLARTAARVRARTAALAHHADDQVELFFLRLLRGAGAEGLGGMRWKGPSPTRSGLQLIRPLLDVSKDVLSAYARDQRLKFREDASNESETFLRNRVRHELLPWLEANYQPALRQVVLRQMELLRAESDFLDHCARERAGLAAPTAFASWPVALQRRHLRGQLRARDASPGFEWIEALRAGADVPVTVPGGRVFARDAGGAVREVAVLEAAFSRKTMEISLGDRKKEIQFEGRRIAWNRKRRTRGTVPRAGAGLEWFDADQVGEIVRLRHWREGDRFQPIGMKSPVKLQDWFTNQKIPRERRRSLVVATTAEGEIWWVEGLRIGERFKVAPGTKRLLRWCWRAVD